MANGKKKNKLLYIVIVGVICFGFIQPGNAQKPTGNKHYVPIDWYANYVSPIKKTPSVYNKQIDVNFEGASLEKALQAIAEKADIRLSYDRANISDQNITLSLKDVTVREALHKVIENTNLELFASPNGQVVIKPAEKLKKKNKAENVRGRVTDAGTGDPIPTVNIRVKGTSIGTYTDTKGKYTVQVPSLQDTLIFSFVGYKTRQIPIKGRKKLNIALSSSTFSAKEITVVAYGEQSTETVTGSISSVSSKEVTESPTSNIGNALSGKMTGLTTIQTTGAPGSDAPSIYIRGISSLNSSRSRPLFILDGVKVDARVVMELDPENVESISVLKDASSLAVYGVEGANGAVVVKTKRGQSGEMKISFSTNVGVQVPFHTPNVANSYDEARMYNMAQINDGTDPDNVRFSDEALEAFRTHSDPIIYPDVDWIDYILKDKAIQTRSNITFSGGNDDVRYLISGGYMKQEGLFKTFNSGYDYNPTYDRYNLRTNLDFDITPSTHISFTGMGRIGKDRSQLAGWDNIYRAAPYAGPGIIDGKLVQTGNLYIPGSTDGVLGDFYGRGYNLDIQDVFNLHLSARQNLNSVTKGLSLSLKGSYNTSFTQQRQRRGGIPTYEPFYKTDVDPSATGDSTIVYKKNGVQSKLDYNESYSKDRSWYVEGRLHYNRDFGPHSIEGLLLYDQRRNYYPGSYTGIPRNLVSSVGRLNYNYDRRYLLEVSAGYNGSENFAPGQRFGLFPAVSAGWIVTNEPYFPDVSFLDFLKFRASYGITGNDTGIGRFLYLPTSYNESSGGYYFGTTNPNASPGASEGSLGNPLVTWEQSLKQDYGVNFRMFQDKFEADLTYFKEVRSDILTTRNTVPAFVSVGLPAVNIGKVQNRGYEAKINWKQSFKDFSYSIGGNLTYAKNKILFIDEVPQNHEYQQKTGKAVSQPFGYIFDRYYTEEDIAKIGNGVADPGYSPKPGDLKFKDLNNDGVIDGADQAPDGYPRIPVYTFGAHLDLGYKNFNVRTVWAGAAHVSRRLHKIPYQTGFGFHGGTSILQWQVDGHWTPEKGQNAKYPRMSLDARHRRNANPSSFWRRDAGYVRLKSAEISYSFGPSKLQFIGLRQLRVFLSGYNLLTFSKLKIIDPEANASTYSSAFNSQYPLTQTFNFGVNVKF